MKSMHGRWRNEDLHLGQLPPKFSANINKPFLDPIQEEAKGCQFHPPKIRRIYRLSNDIQHKVKPWLPEVDSYNYKAWLAARRPATRESRRFRHALGWGSKQLAEFFYYFFKSFCCCCFFSLSVEAKHSSFFEDKGDLPNHTFFVQLFANNAHRYQCSFLYNSTA